MAIPLIMLFVTSLLLVSTSLFYGSQHWLKAHSMGWLSLAS